MKRGQTGIIGKILLFAVIVFNSCQPVDQEPVAIAPPMAFDSVRNEIIQLVKEEKTPSFSVAVLQNGNVMWHESFKHEKDTTSVSISSDAQYPIASLTKSMSATVLLKLVEKGHISLDDKIEKYLPNSLKHYARDSVTIRELLNMTAGIPHGWIFFDNQSPYTSLTNDSLLQHYGMAVFPKGIYEYSNYSYGIIEAVIEEVTNKPYELAIKDILFDPLTMKNSFVEPERTIMDKNIESKEGNMFSPKFYPSGGAGVYSSLSDLILYARLHLNETDNSLISFATLNKLHYDKIYPTTLTALGWGSIPLDNNMTWLVSNGSFPNTANSNLTIIPEHNIAVICLANRDYESSADIMAIKISDVLVPGFAEKAFAKMQAYEAADAVGLETLNTKFSTWEGKIQSGENENHIELFHKNDSLYVSMDKGEWQPIKYATIDHQSIIRGGVTLRLKNPITKQLETSSGNINILITENILEGYFSASFTKEGDYDIAVPFYIKADGKNKIL